MAGKYGEPKDMGKQRWGAKIGNDRAQSDMQRRQLRMDADGTIHEGGKVRLEGEECQLIAAYVRALEGISYREWGIVVDIMEHAFERRQREYMLDLRFDADDEVAKEIMRAGAAR